tara:strand:- start:764992 stop:765579 length:588 start_codon:yes stop_codon:yes gene_type:complete
MIEPIANRWARLRDAFAAMREMIVVMAILGIVFAPDRVQNVLRNAGIQSFAGVEFDVDSLVESEAAVEDAQTNVAQLKQELAAAQQQLSEIALSKGPTVDPRFRSVSQLLERMHQKATATESGLTESLSRQHDLLRRHRLTAVSDPSEAESPGEETEQAPSTTPISGNAQIEVGTRIAPREPVETAMLPPDDWVQ